MNKESSPWARLTTAYTYDMMTGLSGRPYGRRFCKSDDY